MSTDDLQREQQEALTAGPLRERLLHEIACPLPPSCAKPLPPGVTEDEEGKCGGVHPFRELNVTTLARQVDAHFLHCWLEGVGSSQKNAGATGFQQGR